MNFRPFTVTGIRFTTAGGWNHGNYSEPASEEISFTAGVQQPTPEDLELLEEGKRKQKSIVIFTEYNLQIESETEAEEKIPADRIEWENDWYEVTAVKPYRTMFPGNKKAICVKIENT